MAGTTPSVGWLKRHEFLIRRLHSLSGLVPVGAYMCIHLLVNASVLNGPATYQRAVYQIHSAGRLLPVLEWGLIFLPILFHAVLGVAIVASGLPNTSQYAYRSNIRYTLQRATGMIAFFFIVYHVFHMHGWFHFEPWVRHVAEPLGGKQFAPYNAASSLGAAMASWGIRLVYLIGVLACVYHLANGLWTMGITWGVWTSERAQGRARVACNLFGVVLLGVAIAAWIGPMTVDREKAKNVEDRMYRAKIASGELDPGEARHKRSAESEKGPRREARRPAEPSHEN